MTVNDVIDYVRGQLADSATTFYTENYMLGAINLAFAGKVISDLFTIGKFTLLDDLTVKDSDVTVAAVSGKYWKFSIGTDLANTVYKPSIRMYFNKVRVHFMDYDEVWKYENNTLAYFRPAYLGAIVGDEVRIYETGDVPETPTEEVIYVKIPVYTDVTETVELSDDLILGVLVPAACYYAVMRDPARSIEEAEAYLRKYNEYLLILQKSVGGISNPPLQPIVRRAKEMSQ